MFAIPRSHPVRIARWCLHHGNAPGARCSEFFCTGLAMEGFLEVKFSVVMICMWTSSSELVAALYGTTNQKYGCYL
jgi:hypothetical protein